MVFAGFGNKFEMDRCGFASCGVVRNESEGRMFFGARHLGVRSTCNEIPINNVLEISETEFCQVY